ncbi:unnamed protein product [Amoebophrya sp. A25]|nr:unnamed protein product [Amoebophrya sp. A25]|eukprot:GSA25T00008190001.1
MAHQSRRPLRTAATACAAMMTGGLPGLGSSFLSMIPGVSGRMLLATRNDADDATVTVTPEFLDLQPFKVASMSDMTGAPLSFVEVQKASDEIQFAKKKFRQFPDAWRPDFIVDYLWGVWIDVPGAVGDLRLCPRLTAQVWPVPELDLIIAEAPFGKGFTDSLTLESLKDIQPSHPSADDQVTVVVQFGDSDWCGPSVPPDQRQSCVFQLHVSGGTTTMADLVTEATRKLSGGRTDESGFPIFRDPPPRNSREIGMTRLCLKSTALAKPGTIYDAVIARPPDGGAAGARGDADP